MTTRYLHIQNNVWQNASIEVFRSVVISSNTSLGHVTLVGLISIITLGIIITVVGK